MACLNRFFGLSRIFYDRQTSLKDAGKELLAFADEAHYKPFRR